MIDFQKFLDENTDNEKFLTEKTDSLFLRNYIYKLKKPLQTNETFKCLEFNSGAKTITFQKYDDKKSTVSDVFVTLPLELANEYFVWNSTFKPGETYEVKYDFYYGWLNDRSEIEKTYSKEFIEKHMKGKNGESAVFQKGTKFTFIRCTQSGDLFYIDGNKKDEIEVSSYEDVHGRFKDEYKLFGLKR